MKKSSGPVAQWPSGRVTRCHLATSPPGHLATQAGFTLIEVMMGTSIMVIVIVALLGSFFGQSSLNLHSRNLLSSMNDATRIMEQIRQQNTGTSCVAPSAAPPAGFVSWNGWLEGQTPGKSVLQPDPTAINRLELVAVTCQEEGDQDGDGTSYEYCGTGGNAQVGTDEWKAQLGTPTAFDPLRVTVTVGWAQSQRVSAGSSTGAEFTYNGPLSLGGCDGSVIGERLTLGPDADADGVIESPAMLTTLVTCR